MHSSPPHRAPAHVSARASPWKDPVALLLVLPDATWCACPSPIASAPGSPAPQPDLDLSWVRPVSPRPWGEAPGTPYNPTPGGPLLPSSSWSSVWAGAKEHTTMLAPAVPHCLRQHFCAPFMSPAMLLLC